MTTEHFRRKRCAVGSISRSHLFPPTLLFFRRSRDTAHDRIYAARAYLRAFGFSFLDVTCLLIVASAAAVAVVHVGLSLVDVDNK